MAGFGGGKEFADKLAGRCPLESFEFFYEMGMIKVTLFQG
jgi:hypothetical protein